MLVALAALLVSVQPGCRESAPPPDSNTKRSLEQARQLEQTFTRIAATVAEVELAACSDTAIRGAIAKSQNRSVALIDEPSLRRFAQGQGLDVSEPLAYLVPKSLKDRRPTSQVSDEKSATDAAYDALALLKGYDYVAVLRYQLKAPKADGEGFHGGELMGKLALFELKSGKPMCAAPVLVHSHQEIAGKPKQSPQQAADKDFELELRRVLQETLAGMSPELNLELG